MKKIRVKESDIKEGWRYIITAGYCDLQYLLYYKNADFYTCGVYGWKADFYKINDSTIISTGYSPIDIGFRNYETTKKYNEKARKIVYDYDMKYETKIKKLDTLLKKYINEILEGINNG